MQTTSLRSTCSREWVHGGGQTYAQLSAAALSYSQGFAGLHGG